MRREAAEPGRSGRSRRLHLRIPDGWRVLRTAGIGPFTTHALLRRTDGTTVEWNSRRHRKRLGLRILGAGPTGPIRRWLRGADHLSWAMGVLYMVGAGCFAAGSIPAFADAVGAAFTARVFFVGSIFFTTAACVQFYEVVRAPGDVADGTVRPRRLFGLRVRQIDWWSAVVLLVGTILFNVDTFAATLTGESLIVEEAFVWVPDILGCACFLVSSAGSFAEVSPRRWPSLPRGTGWAIALLNVLGSVAFLASAIGAFMLPPDGRDLSSSAAAIGTFIGAAFFFVAAALLPVESSRDRSSSRPQSTTMA